MILRIVALDILLYVHDTDEYNCGTGKMTAKHLFEDKV